jgi:hypothetical protein
MGNNSKDKKANIERADVEKEVERKIDKPDETSRYLTEKIGSRTDDAFNSKKGSKMVDALSRAPLPKDVKLESVDRLNDVVKGTDNVDKVDRFTKRAFNTLEQDQAYIDKKDAVRNNLQKYYDNKNEVRFDKGVDKELIENEKLTDKEFDNKFDDEVARLKQKVEVEKIPSHKIT